MSNKVQERSDLSAKQLTEKLIERGFEVLNVEGNGPSKLRVWSLRCSIGHEFSKTGHRLWTREKCPMCHYPSVEENAARLLIENHFGKDFPNVHPEWFQSEDGNVMELDMFNEDLKLAFEYNGVHHYSPIYGEEQLEKTQKRDEYKQLLCKKMGIRLISIPALKRNTSKATLINHISTCLKKAGININMEVQEKVKEQSFIPSHRTNLFSDLLNETKFKIVEGIYENRYSRLKMEHECGKVYSISMLELKKYSKKREVCSNCAPNSKENALKILEAKKKNGLLRKEAGLKRAKHVGRLLCKENGWIFKEAVSKKHGHISFSYENGGKVFIFSARKYYAFIKENNICMADFEV